MNASGEQNTQVFTPTNEVAALLLRQSTNDKMKYLGCSSVEEMVKNYPACVTEAETQLVYQFLNHPETINYDNDNEPDDNPPQINWSRQKPIEYDEDDTYDNFYMQHEDEFKEMWGKDDYEDAIEDAWEEHQRDKELQKRWGK